jgi:hypothetical protein
VTRRSCKSLGTWAPPSFVNYFAFFARQQTIDDDWIIPPFRDNGRLTATQRDFNHIHSSTRIIVENAFALLKGRFRKLKYVSMNSVDEIPSVVLSCCVLHNICILGDDDSDIAVDDTDNDDQSPEEGTKDVRGLDIRQRVVDFMYGH